MGSVCGGCPGTAARVGRVTDVLASPVRQQSARPWRGLVILVAATLLALAIAIITGVGALSRQGDGKTELLVGSWDAGKIVVAAWMASVVAFFALVCAIPAPRWWLVLFLPLRFLAFCAIIPAAILVALFSESSVVPLNANGCATGYVVRESTPWRHTTVDVLRTDGLLATKVDSGSRRGGENPFAAGDYRVDVDGDTYRVEAVPDGNPSFDLPVIVELTHESCGLADRGVPRSLRG